MNTLHLPPHLTSTRDLLARSLTSNATESAPPPPPELIADLGRRFERSISQPVTRDSRLSTFQKLREFFATPAFGLAAILMIAVIGFPLMRTPSGPDTFRGASHHSAPSVTIVLLTKDPTFLRILRDSGLFEMSAVIETPDPIVAASIADPKLLIDFTSLKMVGYDARSREVVSDDVPSAPDQLVNLILMAASSIH